MGLRIAPQPPPYSAPVQERLDKLMPPGIPPLVLFRVMARDERLFLRFTGQGILGKGHLSLRERELCILRVCANHRSEYEWGVHVAGFAAQAGLTPETIRATVLGNADDPAFEARDRVLIALCDALQTDTRVSDALWQALRDQYAEEAILELLLLTGQYRLVSTLTNTLQMPLEAWAARFPSA